MLLIFSINAIIVAIAVVIHYEVLRVLTTHLPRLPVRPRMRVAYGVLGSMLAHLAEVWVFAIAYYLLIKTGSFGQLEGNFDGSLRDCAYFSITAYSSLGTGDIAPMGLIRFVAGMEALCGLVLITWSASFMFIEMQRYWSIGSGNRPP
ncbi:ion channel [Halioxenophilus sp. WMMB6]|uniref:ion channel n=1 Tax=Halioxenophilus sp. WMMB6 TaxID=3073815 RepID=UPI00295E45A1|nr:ion channel [Halioxenophilus sp. WMMB6]